MRTRTPSPAGHGCEVNARCISIAAATQPLAEEKTAKNASPWVSISVPPCLVRTLRMIRW
jgi:hypothetical protein